ncbi:MAG: PAS domain S-box protein [Lysobacter sp.]|nr:PAS domain S-box protein [Lysobacter sp.]
MTSHDHHPVCSAEQAVRDLAESTPAGMLLLENGRVRWANGKALQLLGHDEAALLGLAPEALFTDAAEARACLAQLPRERTTRLLRVDGSTFQARIGIHALQLEGRPLAVLHVSDLSDSARIHAELAARREELQTLARRLLGVQEDERRTLSRELHDDIGQQLTAIKLGALALRDETEPVVRAELLEEILATADQTLAKLRDLSMLLRPPQLDALGLEAALRWQAERMFRAGKPRLALALAALPQRPDPTAELACFRIAQEAMTNIQRHARAANVTVALMPEEGGRGLQLTVRDDGRGFDPSQPGGLGLVTMRERAQQVGGTLDIDTAPGAGSCVRAHIPLR